MFAVSNELASRRAISNGMFDKISIIEMATIRRKYWRPDVPGSTLLFKPVPINALIHVVNCVIILHLNGKHDSQL